MDVREKLIEILKQAPFEGKVLDEWWWEEKIKRIADHLIAHNVTVQEQQIKKDIVCDYFMTDGVTGEDYCKYGTTEEVKRDNDGWQARMLNTFLGGKV